MKEINCAGIKKAAAEKWEKVKYSFQSYWSRVRPAFQKHGDFLLFALALAILAAVLINLAGNKVITQTAPSIEFTQWWQDNLEKDTLRNLADEFESLHRDIKIVIKNMSYEDLRNDLFNPPETGFAGDVLALDPLWVAELLEKETIETQWTENLPTESQMTGDTQRLDNDAPLLSFINVLYYNVEILKEAGFTRPPKNRSEFINCLRAITGKDKNHRGFILDSKSSRGVYDDIFPWVWSAGVQLIKDRTPAVNSRQVVESLSFLASLHKEGFISMGGANGNKLENFISGKVAFMIAPSSEIALVRERMGDEAFGVSSIPSPDNYPGRAFFASAGWTIGVNTASPHKEEALLFAEFLAGKASLLSEKAHAIPGNGNPSSTQDPFYSKVWDISIATEPANDFTGLPWTALEQIFREELGALFEEKSSPAGTAAAIQQKWEEQLAKQ